jgi:hypothetical protein
MRNQVVAGRTTATTGWPAAAAARVGRNGEVVGREGAELGRELRATAGCQLVSVESRGEPEPRRLLEHAPGLRRAEHAALAEHVREPGPALRHDAGQLFLEQVAHVRLGTAGASPELRRDGVGAEPRRQDVDGALLAELVGDLEQAQLRREVEAVAGLGLDRRRPMRQHLAEPAAPVLGELLVACGPGRRDGRQDSAAGLEDLEVVGAPLAEDELALARSAEQEMRVRVDQAGGDRATAGIESGEARDRVVAALERLEQVVPRSRCDDPALPAGHGGRGLVAGIAARGDEQRRVVHPHAEAESTGHRCDLGGVLDEQARRAAYRAPALDQAQAHRRLDHPAAARAAASRCSRTMSGLASRRRR